MKTILENGAEIIQGCGIKIGLMQTEQPENPEAWLYWLEGQCITSQQAYRQCTRSEAIEQINTWLDALGLEIVHDEICDYSP